MISNDDLYWYRAEYQKNHDGDTVSVIIDLGYSMLFQRDIRMYGINTPELMGATLPQGRAAQQFLEKLLKPSVGTKLLRMKSYKDQDDKYGGRVLGELWLPVLFAKANPTTVEEYLTAAFNPKGTYTNLNQLLIKAGHAKAYFGEGAKT